MSLTWWWPACRGQTCCFTFRRRLLVLFRRINQRGRAIETGITIDYLTLLETFYKEWIQAFDLCPVLTIRADDLDFVHKPKHLAVVVQRIQDRLAGREEVVFPATPEAALRQSPSLNQARLLFEPSDPRPACSLVSSSVRNRRRPRLRGRLVASRERTRAWSEVMAGLSLECQALWLPVDRRRHLCYTGAQPSAPRGVLLCETGGRSRGSTGERFARRGNPG